MVTHPSNVTPESKIDANAGTTVAAGICNPVPGLVNQVEAALTWCERP